MRTKIIAGNLATLVLLGLAAYAMVKSNIEAAFVDEVDSRIAGEYQLVGRSISLSGLELLELVENQAGQRGVQDVFGALDEPGRRQRAFEAAERVSTWLGDPARGRGGRPDVSAIVDDAGRVVARDSDRNAMFGQDLRGQIPALGPALTGAGAVDVWESQQDHKVRQVAVAPIRNAEGRILGALLVGYDLSNGVAEREAALVGRDVGFVWNDTLYSSSLDQGRPQALASFLAAQGQAVTVAARDQQATSAPWVTALGDETYVGVLGPIPGSTAHVALVVLGNRSAQLEKASPVSVILLFTALGALIVAAYGFMIGSSILGPIQQMEEGILQVINGRTEVRLDIQSADFGGLAYRINQLLNVFTGTPETDESGATTADRSRWEEPPSQVDASAVASAASPAASEEEADPELAARLEAEPEDAYYARVYQEYVAAKQAAGENVANIPQDKFTQRLKANEKALLAKHGCRLVRFQVQAKGTQVNLKPVIIR